MLYVATEDGKKFRILCFKEPDYVMNIMASYMTLDELEGSNTKRNYKGRDSESLVKNFKYWQLSGLHFWYHNKLENQNNRQHHPISPERKWSKSFFNIMYFYGTFL